MEQLSLANTRFAVDLFRTLKDNNPSGNIFISPMSISSALAMVFLGARGTTEAQMSKHKITQVMEEVGSVAFLTEQEIMRLYYGYLVMCLEQVPVWVGRPEAEERNETLHLDAVKEIHSSFQSLNADINKRGAPYVLKLANRLYGEKTYEFLPEFLASTKEMYGAELASVDFQRVSEDARKVVNEWVKGQTEGKIPELLAAGVVDNMTKLVLVNAIYFKGNWEKIFRKEATTDTPFRLNKKETKTVKMMYQKSTFPFGYIKDLKCRVLELPYQGWDLSMVILLPDDIEDEVTGLKKIEEQLTLEKLHEWTKPMNLRSFEVNVHLPRFKLEESYNLNSHLTSLGIEDLFNSKADLSGMSRDRGLFISKIIHKSFVEVNEVGTEAAAATALILKGCSLMPETVENFVADHPFIFFIRHNPSTNILFLGRLSSP